MQYNKAKMFSILTLSLLGLVSLFAQTSEPLAELPSGLKTDTSFALKLLQKCLEHDFVVVKKESECFDYAETSWEKEHYKLVEKTCTQYKSRRSISSANMHFRFTASIGIYPDSSMAQMRLDSLRIKPQGLLAEDAKTFPLRAGFRCDSRVVILSTDVSLLKPHLISLASDLEKCLCTLNNVPFSMNNDTGGVLPRRP